MDCIIKKMGAGQTDGSGCMKPCCFQPLLKDGAIFPLFEKEDIIATFQLLRSILFAIQIKYTTSQGPDWWKIKYKQLFNTLT